ncbi:hypothetical protein BV394_12780 [Brevirhabdus pacifica]|uniref:Uncharacterized protein n=1 Tax=Brevirhabdus pacifica TaxID=1267768 RepID=A0A1U7DKS2_9RHOB|nr:universal stress protein [Brevirhabdus pacifica]APX90493.1 hypothetical protein BV394_12780 [Brevirhabdus pacifica]OWU78493.1 hypothetical protein ATO5_06685 [Loktanella sp. 22II-4b]PJJ85399.1 nucleotide-binding universal stress UspA family protein [Brevirhabdus pacifica]
MSYRTIVTLLNDPEAPTGALEAAIALASAQDAHLDVICLGIDRTDPGLYYAGSEAIAIGTAQREARANAAQLEERVTERLAHESLPWEVQIVTVHENGLYTSLTDRMRYADMAVMPTPYTPQSRGEEATAVEAALFGADIPIVIVPEGLEMPPRFSRVMVGWDESDQALAAVRAALPIVTSADEVEITVIDPPRRDADSPDPGGRLARFIDRHGGNPEIAVLARSEPNTANMLNTRAIQGGYDLLVIGAYGHSRLREAFLGGVTRDMLRDAKVPVLLAR